MSSKIFKAIWLVTLTVFLASLIFIMGAAYSYFSSVQKSQLRVETKLAAQGVTLAGMDYFDGLESGDYRITWIDSDGHILRDNEADSSEMENHLEREEVKEAIENGFGESSRYSKTLSEKLYYAAQLLPDGTVVRVSQSQSPVWTLLLGFAQPIAVVALFAMVLSFVLASRLSKKIIEPINEMDLEKPQNYVSNPDFAELQPLLLKLSAQQAEIKKNQRELEENSQVRQEFTANASHELKTPLQTISGYAELLENNLVNQEDVSLFAGKIHQEAQRMTKLIGDIIDLTKLDSGSEGTQWKDTDLLEIAQKAIDSVRQEADARNISLSLEGEKAVVYGIPQVLYSIVFNLCDNAVKYNKPGGSAEVSVHNKKNKVELTVSDTGIGIPEKYQARIFERFYRVDKSHSREIGGTGLGLSIVKHGVMIHHADISVESTENEGTTFTVIFKRE